MENMKEHWNSIYSSTEIEKLGWYEEMPAKCLELFNKCNLNKNDAIIDIGCGTSSFIGRLLGKGFTNIIGVDISKAALDKLNHRLGSKATTVKWIVDDIGHPVKVQNLRNIALWHDRAVLHFLLGEDERQSYLKTLKTILRKNGYAIIATFNLEGAKKCSGLDIRNYGKGVLIEFLGDDFELKESFDYIYKTPSGSVRPYIYTLFQRIR